MLALLIGKGFVPLLLALVLPGRSDCVGVGARPQSPSRTPNSLTTGISTEKRLRPRVWRDIDREAGISSH